MDELPEGWAETTLGEVAQVVGGGTPRASDASNFQGSGGTPWLTPADLSGFRGKLISRGVRNLSEKGLQSCSAKLLPAGTVLMSSRAPIGYLAIAANPIATNQGFKSFVCSEALTPDYLFHWLTFMRPQLEDMASGTTFLELSGSRAKEIPVRFPPLAEQKRIVEKVEALLAQVQAARDRLERVQQILKRFRQAVLAAACEGRLSSSDSDSWRSTTLGAVCREITVGHVGPMAGEYVPSGVPFLRSQNVRPFRFDPTGLKYISRSFHGRLRKTRLTPGDVVVVRSGNAGVACVVPPDLLEANCADLVILRPSELLNPEFAVVFLNSGAARSHVDQVKVGIAQGHFNIGDAREMPIRLPPVAVQGEIVARAFTLLGLADSIERRCTRVRRVHDAIPQAVLAKAFVGELVGTEAKLARAEGREFESGEELLARVRGAQASDPQRPSAAAPRRARSRR